MRAMEATLARQDLLRRGRRLEVFTILWNSAEGLVSVALGALAGSIALIGFGIPESSFAECVGKGNREPVAPNDRAAANMKKNRRVEIYVLSSSGALNTSAPKRDRTTK